ncbi:hypothetical protein Lesp02_53410 [Lentzea sp. NBRC 105346]|nr:hypothetical protein Lesp02_53410 [Lentzea sp. NBRC 105346]
MSDYPQPQRVDQLDKDALLDSLITEALARDEIRPVIGPRGVTEQALRTEGRSQAATVFLAAEPEENAWRTAVDAAANLFVSSNPVRDLVWALIIVPVVQFVLLGWLVLSAAKVAVVPMLLVLAGIAVVGAAIGGVNLSRALRPDGDGRRKGESWSVVGMVAGVVELGWLAYAWIGWSWWLVPVGFGAFVVLAIMCIPAADVFPSEHDRAKQAKAAETFRAWKGALLEKGLLPALRTFINVRETAGDYSTTLTVRATPGLKSADYVLTHVSTPASERLVRLVDSVAGGSFALAGPRGAGKTNLLRAYCGGQYRDENRGPDLAVFTSAPVEYQPEQFVLHLFTKTCQAAIAYARQAVPDVMPGAGTRLVRKVRSPFADDGRPRPGQFSDLVATAEECLSLIRYVRTYSTEATVKGGAKVFEVAGKAGLSMAGRALTYPELVDRFREFLADAVAVLEAEAKSSGREPGRVVIGIDELDRIGAGDPARRLLNEIKAIFDVRGCYYLVSVSTEAQHDFELSGIGLRSTFDSSFDEVVRVDHLNFENAKVLLRRHVIGLSEQFLALAYVFSGGLARQLVRTVRTIVELADDHIGQGLRPLAEAVAEAELVRACHATVDALITVPDRADVTELVRALDDRAGAKDLAYCERLLASYTGESAVVVDLRDAVAARVCFLATVIEVFDENLTRERMLGRNFDLLARARRYAGNNPATALALLADIREQWGLSAWSGRPAPAPRPA